MPVDVRRLEASPTVETHIATLAFDGDLVHKRKKAVRFPFVDLSTPERRAEACRREVELNRRFAPDVYLGVEDVVDDAGRVVDQAVLMRRMPAERCLATLIHTERDTRPCVRAIARAIAVAHASAPRDEDISAVAAPAALHMLWEASLHHLAAYTPDILDTPTLRAVEALACRYLNGRTTLLDERIARGQIVDGHGDLLADDIFCLDDGPRILDCLEFDDRLRWGDVLNDVGFLAMDLEHHGRPDLATQFLDAYQELSAEVHPPSLLHHYIAYRALVRAKVSCLRAQPEDSRAYLAQCWRHLREARVQLVVIGGLPGTGKSTLAAAIGDELGWPVLRTDDIRWELPRHASGAADGEAATSAHGPSAYGTGDYAPAMKDRTYRAVLNRAGDLLSRGISVVVDGSFVHEHWRAEARHLATWTHADLTELRCVLPAALAARRIAARATSGADPSQATAEIAARMAAEYEPWPAAVEVDTCPPVAELVPPVLEQLGRADSGQRDLVATSTMAPS
jgi:aminoglycoside phosphotransferase family enzyme/predicted kinase